MQHGLYIWQKLLDTFIIQICIILAKVFYLQKEMFHMSSDHTLSPKSNNTNLIVLLHAFALVCFLAADLFIPVSFDLKALKDLIVSEATADGVDIGMRINMMYGFVFGGAVAVAVFYKLFKYIETRFAFSFLRQYELMLLSATIICMAFLQAMDAKSMTTLRLLEVIFWFRLLVLLPVKRLDAVTCILKRKIVFSLCLIFAFFALFANFLLLGSTSFVRENIVWIFSAFLLLFSAVYIFFCKEEHQRYKQITAFLLPLTAVPYVAFLSLEILFYIRESKGYFIPYKWLFVILFAVVWLVMNFFFLRKKKKAMDVSAMIRRWIGPSAVVGFVLLAFYAPVLQPVNEMFEYANFGNSMMNVFAFGKVPFLDFMSTHMMVEQWFGYLYFVIFGYNASMDFLVYGFLNTLFFYFIMYGLLNSLFRRPLLSLFFLFFFPFIPEMFYVSILVAVIPFFLSKELLERPATKGFLKLFLILLGLLFWKIDTGISTIFAATFYFPLLYFVAHVRFPLKAFLKGLALFALLCAALFSVAALLRSPAVIINNIKMAMHLYSASQAHGLTDITANYVQQFYVYHILFPLVGMICCGSILLILRKKPMNGLLTDSYLLLGSLFLFLLFFSNLQRGLVRHSFAERNETLLVSTFFAALSLLVVYLFRARKPVINMTLFYTTGFSLFILLKFFPYHTSEATLDFALNHNGIATVNTMIASPGYKHRTMVDTAFANENYMPLKDFLDKNITKEQTFLDLSNAPMLYFYCQRSVVGFFNQNMQNTVDDYLQLELLKTVDTNRVPVVVFASYPRAWFDATDNIQNVLRYYLIAEYIFHHYKPYGVIGNKSVWVANTFHPVTPAIKIDELLDQPDNAQLKLIPEYTGLFYSKPSNAKDLQVVYEKNDKDFNLSGDSLNVLLDSSLLALQHCYLSIEFKPSGTYFDPMQMQVLFRDTMDVNTGVFSFTRRDLVSETYMIRLSNHYFWHRYNSLKLCIPAAAAIKRIAVLKDVRMND